MFRSVRISRPFAALVLAAIAAAGASIVPHATAANAPKHARGRAVAPRTPYHSRELWATINICNAKDKPNVVGIRGSMPGDGEPKDAMYMGFRLQYLDATTGKWLEDGKSANSGMLKVGSASATRQYGFSFTLTNSSRLYQLRGIVSFQWLRGKRVVYSTQRATSAGHKNVTGADPPSYSNATCLFS